MSVEKRRIDPLRLSSCHIIEVLSDDSILWSWSYPHLSSQLRTICSSKCKVILSKSQNKRNNTSLVEASSPSNHSNQQAEDGRQNNNDNNTMYGRNFHLDKLWFYVVFPTKGVQPSRGKVSDNDDNNDDSQQAKMIGVVVAAEDFCPEMYERVGNALYLTYMKTRDPSIVLQQFLSLIVEGTCLLPKKKTFSLADHSLSYDKHQIKEIILRFGLETILIYTALQRKRRIVVYHYDIDVLSDFTLSLPILSGDYSNEIWNSIYPWVDLNDDELEFIKNIPFYVMGCTAAGVETSTDLFDVFVNIPAAEIYVAPHARESIAMNKTHKEMATFMVQLASNENASEEELVAGIMKRNVEMNNKL